MADTPRRGRPDGSGDGGREGPDFTWLYGGRPDGAGTPPEPADPNATRAIRQQPRPDPADEQATQVMRTQPRDDATAPRGAAPAPAPTPQPLPPPREPRAPRPPRTQGGWSARLRRPRFWIRTVVALLVVWLVFTIATPFIVWQNNDPIAFTPEGDRPADQPGTTYLLVGNDSRASLSEEERRRFNTGNPETNLTDTIMLLHTGSGPSVLLSIPRDTVLDIPGFGSGKVNGAFPRGGAPLLVQTLEQATGVRIDEYVEIGLGGVAGVVDAVGGIEVCPRVRMVDRRAGLRISKGCQEVDGETALAYSRSRYESRLGDLDRVRRQREVVGAIGDKVLSPWTVVNPVRWWRLNTSVPDFFGFGDGTNMLDAGRWALAMTRTGSGDNLTCTMPVTSSSAETWDMDRAQPLLDAIIEDRTDDITRDQCTASGVARG